MVRRHVSTLYAGGSASLSRLGSPGKHASSGGGSPGRSADQPPPRLRRSAVASAKAESLALLIAVAISVLASLAAVPRADVRASRRDASLMKQKVATITAHGERSAGQARRTTVTENEVNSYLVYEAGEQLPTGVVDPSVTILGTGRVSGRAVVDLDAVRKQKNPTSLLDPMNYLMGRLPVTAVGVLKTSNGVGPRRAADLEHAGLITIEDLLYRFPLRYEDRSRLQPIASLKPGQMASIAGRVLACGLRSTRRVGFKIFEAAVDDGSGSIRAVWLNQSFLRDVFMRGQHVVLYGAVEMRGSVSLQMTNTQHEILDEEDAETIHTGRIVPVYEKTRTVLPKMQRRLVYEALQRLPADLPDHLPEDLRIRLGLPSRSAALLAAHFPPPDAPIDALNRFATPSQQRLIFEEAFLFQMGVLARRQSAAAEHKPVAIHVDDRIRASARAVLPFRLTGGQRQALKEIVGDLQKPHPMNRLLQGDVGGGKTS